MGRWDAIWARPRAASAVPCVARVTDARSVPIPARSVSHAEDNKKKFTLTIREDYEFEVETEEQAKKIVETARILELGFKDGAGAGSGDAKAAGPVEPAVKEAKQLTIEDFDLLKVIGQGSFGKVMQVRKKDTGMIYAMKVLKKAELVKRNQLEHTKSEREILGRLRHPFMVNLHYSFQSDHKLYMILDYVNGGEMYYHLQKAVKFTVEQARFYAAEVVLVLEHLHSRDVVYRDLKPENILLGADGHIVMTDFGLSKLGITSVGGTGSGQATGTFCGTPEYLAPEILTGTAHGTGVDWWSVGIMLYEMIVGASPFYSDNRKQLYENCLKGRLSFPEDMPPHSEDILRGLLTADPTKRLGCRETGASEIKDHPFFASIDWKELYNKALDPPFIPKVSGEQDVSNVHPHYLEQKAVDSPVDGPPVNCPEFAEWAFNEDTITNREEA